MVSRLDNLMNYILGDALIARSPYLFIGSIPNQRIAAIFMQLEKYFWAAE
jgi:hypothetical protein